MGDCLLTSSFLSYCGAFTYDYRDSMVYQLWLNDVSERKLPVSTPFRCCWCYLCIVLERQQMSFKKGVFAASYLMLTCHDALI